MVYMGSKARIIKHFLPLLELQLPNAKGYVEPFVGGANVIQHVVHPNRFGLDNNKYLIALLKYAQVLSNPLPATITEEEYNQVRDNKDTYPDWYVGLVGFCATFGGKWFNGYARTQGRDIPRERINNLNRQRICLQGIEFAVKDFTEITDLDGFVIYCDPPYKGTTKYKDSFDHELFWKTAEKWAKSNTVFVSEYNAPLHWSCVWEYPVTTMLNKKNYKTDVERLFTL